jgi:hypothetical protein
VLEGTLSHYAQFAATPIEYLVRLEGAVHDSATWSRASEYQAIRGKILELCEGCKTKIFDEADLFRRIYQARGKDEHGLEDKLSDAEALAVRALLRSTAGTFSVLHELLLFLPRESIRAELTNFCECLFRKEFDSSKLSLILTSLFNAFEYSLDDVMRFLEADVFKFKIPDPKALSFGNVMELAIVDRNNPLAWAVLAHEFGHFLDHDAGITKHAVEEFTKSATSTPFPDEFVRALERLCSEIVADLTGYYLQGPCSILPLVNMSILVGCIQEAPIKFDGEHGAPTTRVEMIRSLCRDDHIDISRISPHLETLMAEERHKEDGLSPVERTERGAIHQFLTVFFDRVRPVILDELGKRQLVRFTPAHYSRAETLSKRLATGLPIGASRVSTDEEARKQLVIGRAEVGARDKYHLLAESAVEISEVITAGWINRTTRTVGLFAEAFAKKTREDVFRHLADGFRQEDDLLFRSIDMIPMLESYHAPAR